MTKRRNKPCKNCNGPSIRIDQYDAIACKSCVIWLETKCSDSTCEFCSKRPETPDKVYWNDPNNT